MSDNLSQLGQHFIPLAEPKIGGNEWEYVKECLDTSWVSSAGSYVDRFERELAEYLGTRHAVATSSGTAALHIALLLAGVEPDDEVLVSTLTFIAPANARPPDTRASTRTRVADNAADNATMSSPMIQALRAKPSHGSKTQAAKRDPKTAPKVLLP